MKKDWFEMMDIRKRSYDRSVWIPLRARVHNEINKYGHIGYQSEFFGVGSIAIPINKKSLAEKLEWMDIGILHDHKCYIEKGKYIPSNIYKNCSGSLIAERLVIDQSINSLENDEWHLNQDFVIALGLKREGDMWLNPNEDYIVVAKLQRDKNNSPSLFEVRASYLKDYLCARNMALYISSYHQRIYVVDSINHFDLKPTQIIEDENKLNWEFRIIEINEGGMPFNSPINVHVSGRTDVDNEEDVPKFDFPTDDVIKTESYKIHSKGNKLFNLEGELWKYDWFDPSSLSPIVRGDKTPSTIFFIIDAEGKKANKENLINSSRWLWFDSSVIQSLVNRRGGSLIFNSKDTGYVSCSPDSAVQFGINKLGMINVYAKDIGLLPEWQQKIWSGFNLSPDGKVSEELLTLQMKCESVHSQAPEVFLQKGLNYLNDLFFEKFGIKLLKFHSSIPEISKRTHRFRSIDQAGLLSLAKDVTRLTADSIDTSALQKIIVATKDEKLGSLKSLEKLLATKIDPSIAHELLSSLFGVYELRLGDAHLPSSKINEAFELLRIDLNLPFVEQGYQLLESCVTSIYGIIDVLKSWDQ